MIKAVPLNYVLRNLWVRRVTTVLTAGGMALVVFVFATVLMMSEGIRESLVATGQPDNVLALRKGATTEVNSTVTRQQGSVIEGLPGLATDAQGRKLVSREVLVLNSLPKRSGGEPSNVPVRGLSELGVVMRPQVRIVQGRMFRAGTSEIVAGGAVARGFAHAGVGETLRFAGREWTVVGIIDAEHTGFDSEMWGDVDQILQAFHRNEYSSVMFKLADVDSLPHVAAAVEGDPRLSLEVKAERQFYAEQSESMSNLIRVLGLALSVIFSIGAIVGAMITMFAAVASRVAEIGAMRALGFRREAVLVAFLCESLGFSVVGGLVGLAAASVLQTVDISTVNLRTFSEMAFRFHLTPGIAAETMGFSLFMGVVGGLFPAWRAARLSIVDCLRAA